MRYDLHAGSSHVFVRMHAFLHKATASTEAVRGWFEVASSGDLLAGTVDGVAEVDVGDFEFTNSMVAIAARAWLDQGKTSALHFELTEAGGAGYAATIHGRLTIGDVTRDISTEAMVSRSGDDVVVEGSWQMSQKEFGLSAPIGVKDEVDVEFRLVGHPSTR